MRKRAAAVNVGHQQTSRITVHGHAHIDDVAAGQIDLGRRTRALDHHHIILRAQRVQRGRNLRPDQQTAAAPGHGG